MEQHDEPGEMLRALAVLGDPSRRRLYEAVRGARTPVTREQAAELVGISRKLAAFHLDKLVAAGLLVAEYERQGRSVLGRPPKVYRPVPRRLRVSIPERRPDVLAEVLLDAIASTRAGESPSDAALRAGHEAGLRLGAQVRAEQRPGRLGAERALTLAQDVLTGRGFEPARESATCLLLLNCPFQPLTDRAADLVCRINAEFMKGLLAGLQAGTAEAVLKPSPGRCCVELRASTT